MERIAPDIARAAIQLPDNTMDIFEMAKKYNCSRVQFWLGIFDEELIKKFHNDGISCNLYYADDIENYEKYFSMGIDTLLTNRMDLANDYKRKKGNIN